MTDFKIPSGIQIPQDRTISNVNLNKVFLTSIAVSYMPDDFSIDTVIDGISILRTTCSFLGMIQPWNPCQQPSVNVDS